MPMGQIYCPDNVWVIRFNGLGSDPDAEPVTICSRTRNSAIQDFRKLAEDLKRAYPNHTWFDDSEDSRNKISLRLESTEDPRIFVHAERVRFVAGGMAFWQDGPVGQDDVRLWAKGFKVKI